MFWKRFFLGLLIALNLFLGYRLFFDEQGFFAYRELERKFTALQDRVRELDERNLRLSREIRLLQSDTAYIEKVAREKMQFLRDDEILYMFSGTPQTKIEDSPGAGPDEREN